MEYIRIMSIEETYDHILQGDLDKFPSGTWAVDTDNTIGRVIRHLIERVLHWTDDDIREKFCCQVLREYKLGGAYSSTSLSTFEMLNLAYPDRFKPWELKRTQRGSWSNALVRIRAVKWLVEEKLALNPQGDIRRHISNRDFERHGLRNLLHNIYNGNILTALGEAYPGRIYNTQIRQPRRITWSKRSSALAVREMIEERLRWTEDDVRRLITPEIFKDYGLSNMFKIAFGSNLVAALEAAYPGVYPQKSLQYFINRKARPKAYSLAD